MEKVALSYSEVCRVLGLACDPAVLVSLETNWEYICASNAFSLLPLLVVVEDARNKDFRSKLKRFRLVPEKIYDHSLPNSLAETNARVVHKLLELCPVLEMIDVTNCGIGSVGIMQIGQGISKSTSIREAYLRGNPRGFKGFASGEFVECIASCGSLELLDISQNLLEFVTIREVKAKLPKSTVLVSHGSYPFEEALNTATHGIGVLLAILGSAVLLHHASSRGRTVFYASCIYSFTLIFLYSCSSIYHFHFANKSLTYIFGILDHSAIYFLIAGSYTPFCMVSLRDHSLGLTILAFEWISTFIGIVMIFISKRVHFPLVDVIELGLYVGMGWAAAFVWNDVVDKIGSAAFDLLVYGGYAYTGGIVFFMLEKQEIHPLGHAIWHLFVLAGSAFHYFAILLYVVGLQDYEMNPNNNSTCQMAIEA